MLELEGVVYNYSLDIVQYKKDNWCSKSSHHCKNSAFYGLGSKKQQW